MSRLAIFFLLLTVAAGLVSFGWIDDIAWPTAKLVCFVSLTLFVLSFCTALMRPHSHEVGRRST